MAKHPSMQPPEWVIDEAWIAAQLLLHESDAEGPVDEWSEPHRDPALPWSVTSGVEHDHAVDRLEAITRSARASIAEQYGVIAGVLRDAAEVPEPWVGQDPTLDPSWVDPRRRSAATVRAERREFAVRAAVADVAIRLRLSEMTVRTRGHVADALRQRCPRLWATFAAGDVDERNAITAAEFASSLPDDAPEAWAAFDDTVTAVGSVLTPAKFRITARAARERVHRESIEVRACRAAEDRRVWVTPELDGMATLTAILPATDAHAAMGRLDAIARHLHDASDETRTLAQLRADAFADLLTTASTEASDAGKASRSKPSVAITVPVLSLLGESEEPATLDGYGPIDLDTARRLAGDASSWVRILTHPITGTVLDVDRTTYRVSAALRRWLGTQHPTCITPGCSRPARECDMDHVIDWQFGGTTKDTNLAPECEPHHRLKHGSLWHISVDDDTGRLTYSSPTGHVTEPDPAPF
ncbi:DUF222 domain-containing protein [Microbacterium sp. P04]|uniref:HNH endonuclease signature motif containing protein n=1 Tax=Microbacterium sp. P04 TaxID=3366947 RepID=UPI003746AD13